MRLRAGALLALCSLIACSGDKVAEQKTAAYTTQDAYRYESYDRGKAVFTGHCISCHHFSADKAGFVPPAALAVSQSNSRDSLLYVMQHDSLHQPFIQAMTPPELAYLLVYLNNAKDNGGNGSE